MTKINPADIIGKTYLTEPSKSGIRHRLEIIEQLDLMHQQLNRNPTLIQFRAVSSDEFVEEIITYNQILDKVEANDGDDDQWKFTAIIGHERTLNQNYSNDRGSIWNLEIK